MDLFEILAGMDLKELANVENVVIILLGFLIGKIKPASIGRMFVKAVKKVTPKWASKIVLSSINLFAKSLKKFAVAVDGEIDDTNYPETTK